MCWTYVAQLENVGLPKEVKEVALCDVCGSLDSFRISFCLFKEDKWLSWRGKRTLDQLTFSAIFRASHNTHFRPTKSKGLGVLWTSVPREIIDRRCYFDPTLIFSPIMICMASRHLPFKMGILWTLNICRFVTRRCRHRSRRTVGRCFNGGGLFDVLFLGLQQRKPTSFAKCGLRCNNLRKDIGIGHVLVICRSDSEFVK